FAKILHFEDDPTEAQLVKSAIQAIDRPFEVLHVDRHESFVAALEREAFDLILCDYNIAGYWAPAAIEVALQKQPGVPVIVVSGSVDEKEAVECLRKGATDFLWKNQLERFVPVIKRALREAERSRAQLHAEQELRQRDALLGLASRLVRMGGWAFDLSLQKF